MSEIYSILNDRILILDGGLGTMVQRAGLGEKDFRGEKFAAWPMPLMGCNDVLALTRPDVIRDIHEQYLAAGADIISTDTFNATRVSLADYGLQEHAYEVNRAAATVARGVVGEWTRRTPEKPRFVAGSMGPTGKTASMSADVSDPAARDVTFDELAAAYAEQARGLRDGGADILLIETIFDTLNAKAAIYAIRQICGFEDIPIMLSGTLADASGRTLSGQTVEAFYASVTHARPLSVGFNCAYGAAQLRPYLARLAAVSAVATSAHPNAGLPNVMGGYDETPEAMAAHIEEYLKEGLVNIVGGCCGTTPAHIEAIAKVAQRYKPRRLHEARHTTTLSGLEPLVVAGDFVNVGERTNVAGSAKFARLVRDEAWDEAAVIARRQVEAGAQVIDVCMDDGLIDGPQAMTKFLNLAVSDPEIAARPLMIDSSRWETLVAGLKCAQGKSIVNSISLKEGEAEFVRRAREIRAYGAAAVVMLFDERGQADTYERKIEVAARAYGVLVEEGFPPEDIVFDPNVLTVGTGIAEHDDYGVAFIEAVRWIKKSLPHAKTSGGVSNLSFAFRGNNTVREAMHSVFLHHAIEAGLDMAIVNPAAMLSYADIGPELLTLAEDVVLNRRADAAERLAAYAASHASSSQTTATTTQEWRNGSLEERVEYAMTCGVADHIEADTLEGYALLGAPLAVIDQLLMPAMERIGQLFAEGRMFLPQVVRSARVMKRAVGALAPYMEKNASANKAGRVVMATVKGDVHDIGKNIVSVVMACNGYEVSDLGVMVDKERIVEAATLHGADAIGLSGLISPSLDEMTQVVVELERCGLRIPVIVGGATTSELHTAVKIAPNYSGLVVHSRDASDGAAIVGRLLGASGCDFAGDVRRRQAELREQWERRAEVRELVSLAEARGRRLIVTPVPTPLRTGRETMLDVHLSEVAELIDWDFFFPAWGLKGCYPALLDDPEKGEQARRLLDDARAMLARLDGRLTLKAVAGIYPAHKEGDDIVLTDGGREFRLAQLRNQEKGQEHNLSLVDFIAEQDHVGAFALTAGAGLAEFVAELSASGDDYGAIMAKLLADRLAEALAEFVHSHIKQAWGVAEVGIRVAFGYPSCPDHSLKREVFELLDVEREAGMTLTENYMIAPGESVCGLVFANPAARYFDVGRISGEQLDDYAHRRGLPTEEIARLIPRNL
ncbi:MAG: methionine synthase [Rikenellaceae bacterium]|nr:methionine synthase [Rikenellaceae bacterium]MCL2693264.1 methionine synthase [Rikenellaceae bacterium]